MIGANLHFGLFLILDFVDLNVRPFPQVTYTIGRWLREPTDRFNVGKAPLL